MYESEVKFSSLRYSHTRRFRCDDQIPERGFLGESGRQLSQNHTETLGPYNHSGSLEN